MASCTSHSSFKTGDLIFVGIRPSAEDAGNMASAITAATGDAGLSMIHVGILELDEYGTWVIDATPEHGIARRTLDEFECEFRRDDSSTVFSVMRPDAHNLDEFVANAKKFIGEKYDFTFLPDNDMHYCSELVYDAYKLNGASLFDAVPMNFKAPDGSFPEYWENLFGTLGMAVPQGVPGTNPQDMSQSTLLIPVVQYR